MLYCGQTYPPGRCKATGGKEGLTIISSDGLTSRLVLREYLGSDLTQETHVPASNMEIKRTLHLCLIREFM